MEGAVPPFRKISESRLSRALKGLTDAQELAFETAGKVVDRYDVLLDGSLSGPDGMYDFERLEFETGETLIELPRELASRVEQRYGDRIDEREKRLLESGAEMMMRVFQMLVREGPEVLDGKEP